MGWGRGTGTWVTWAPGPSRNRVAFEVIPEEYQNTPNYSIEEGVM